MHAETQGKQEISSMDSSVEEMSIRTTNDADVLISTNLYQTNGMGESEKKHSSESAEHYDDSIRKGQITALSQDSTNNVFVFLEFLSLIRCQQVNSLWLQYCKQLFQSNIRKFALSAAKLKHLEALDDIISRKIDHRSGITKVTSKITQLLKHEKRIVNFLKQDETVQLIVN